ncbi:hypothetical protein BZG02_20455 [Labilibaculum filiforme]|uniref:Uncharacterized protein n=1 Tax=Labilibaculum filiforme TaxID=1940526 RepID=A0A2N3HQ53_9BACT|nr:hypothetical protein [Labilibaculum filiforme]PKQ60183.1 hypothetical protein BZG02_20455 [Labilibaculum filiforme]
MNNTGRKKKIIDKLNALDEIKKNKDSGKFREFLLIQLKYNQIELEEEHYESLCLAISRSLREIKNFPVAMKITWSRYKSLLNEIRNL